MRETIALRSHRTSTKATTAGSLRSAKWTILGRDRSYPHLQRKIYHAVMGLLCFGLYAFVLTREQALATLAIVGGTWIALDLLRLRVASFNALVLRYFGSLMRREELNRVSANSYYILGLFVVTALFPTPIALLCVLFLAFGDPIAAIVGTLYGRRKLIGKKSVEGTAANFVVSAVVTFLFAAGYLALPMQQALVLAFLGGIVSAVAELCPLPGNDNLTIPVLAGLQLQAIALLLPFY